MPTPPRLTPCAVVLTCVGKIDRPQQVQSTSPIRVIRLTARESRFSLPWRFTLGGPGLTVLSHELELAQRTEEVATCVPKSRCPARGGVHDRSRYVAITCARRAISPTQLGRMPFLAAGVNTDARKFSSASSQKLPVTSKIPFIPCKDILTTAFRS